MEKVKEAYLDLLSSEEQEEEVVGEILEELSASFQELEERVDTKLKTVRSGTDGLKGDKGDKGKDGKDGKDGAQGPKGDRGPQGPHGKDGKDGKFEDEEELVNLRNRLNTIGVGGGNANRNIAIGGNGKVLQPYTDINLKAGANVTITYAANNTTKYTDVTVAATGGAGTVRSINTISTSQTAAATAGTDYVYICAAGVNLTLPTAVSNTNLYTVKNTSASSVLVSTTASETIDAQSNLILAVQYTAVDLISDSANWNIT